jgi:Spy/CpxP family protein refolding chaperone
MKVVILFQFLEFLNKFYFSYRSPCTRDQHHNSSPMKNSFIIAIICIGIGIAVGWNLKPTATPEPEIASSDITQKKHTREITQSLADNSSPSVPRKSRVATRIITPDQDGKETNPLNEAMLNNLSKVMMDKQKAKLEARIALLVDKLNLTPAQEAKLRALADTFNSDAEDKDSNLTDFASLLTDEKMDSTLAGILTPEQKEEYDALKNRETINKVEASALKNLAKLSFLDMSQEQKDAAYEILHSEAKTSVGKNSPASDMMSIVSSSVGVEIDADALDLSGIADAQFNTENGTTDPNDMMARMKESQAKRINDKVEALRPILDEKQLKQYRAHLESNSSGYIGVNSFK